MHEGGRGMMETLGGLSDMMFHIVIYLFLWRILSELNDIKKILKEKEKEE
jgi:hypothetical protein